MEGYAFSREVGSELVVLLTFSFGSVRLLVPPTVKVSFSCNVENTNQLLSILRRERCG